MKLTGKAKARARKAAQHNKWKANQKRAAAHKPGVCLKDHALHYYPADGMPVEEFVLRNISCSRNCSKGRRWAAQFQTEYAQRISGLSDFVRAETGIDIAQRGGACEFLDHLVETLKRPHIVMTAKDWEPILNFQVIESGGQTRYVNRLAIQDRT